MKKLVNESINEAYRVGVRNWKNILKDIKNDGGYSWSVNMKQGTATQYFNNEDELDEDSEDELKERSIVLSNPGDNDYIEVTLYDEEGNVLDSNEWDAEGLSADEVMMDAFRQVDCDL